jgi:hypothetical protein
LRGDFGFAISAGLVKASAGLGEKSGAGGNLKEFMQKVIGVICLVVGLLLLLQGHDVANSVGSQFTKAFTGEPLGKATRCYVAGAAVGLFGAFLIFWKRK